MNDLVIRLYRLFPWLSSFDVLFTQRSFYDFSLLRGNSAHSVLNSWDTLRLDFAYLRTSCWSTVDAVAEASSADLTKSRSVGHKSSPSYFIPDRINSLWLKEELWLLDLLLFSFWKRKWPQESELHIRLGSCLKTCHRSGQNSVARYRQPFAGNV